MLKLIITPAIPLQNQSHRRTTNVKRKSVSPKREIVNVHTHQDTQKHKQTKNSQNSKLSYKLQSTTKKSKQLVKRSCIKR